MGESIRLCLRPTTTKRDKGHFFFLKSKESQSTSNSQGTSDRGLDLASSVRGRSGLGGTLAGVGDAVELGDQLENLSLFIKVDGDIGGVLAEHALAVVDVAHQIGSIGLGGDAGLGQISGLSTHVDRGRDEVVENV